jgi:hypothetical protein
VNVSLSYFCHVQAVPFEEHVHGLRLNHLHTVGVGTVLSGSLADSQCRSRECRIGVVE